MQKANLLITKKKLNNTLILLSMFTPSYRVPNFYKKPGSLSFAKFFNKKMETKGGKKRSNMQAKMDKQETKILLQLLNCNYTN